MKIMIRAMEEAIRRWGVSEMHGVQGGDVSSDAICGGGKTGTAGNAVPRREVRAGG
jgi:hypothetical protein